MADAARLRRLLSLIPYVLKHQGATFDELCEVFGVSRAQLVDDLNLIFLCGQPDYSPADLIDVVIDGDRVYIGMADYFSRPLRFTPAELSGLYLACSALARLAGAPASPGLSSVMEKIRVALGMEELSPEEVEQSLELASHAAEGEILSSLARACEESLVVDMEYYSYGRDELTRRRVSPLSLEFGMGHWYLRAWDEPSGEARVFRVDRIKELTFSGETFRPPEKEEESGGPYGAVKEGGITVRLRFAPALAGWAREQPIFDGVEEEGPFLVCSLKTDKLSWLERELLSWGPGVEVLEPRELREGLRRRVERILSLYTGKDGKGGA
ncbi:MAG: WYL domain-containing protein [Actinobacteria bacterium]|nr:WYL domain-containing protein [Actinomycetota bacterium]